MSKVLSDIKNFIQLHTSDMEDKDYMDLMRSVAEWANSQADTAEFRADNYDVVFPIID